MTAEAVREGWSEPRQDRERFHRVAEVDGTIVGSTGLWIDPTSVHLGGYVTPTHRRRGIGSALWGWAETTIAELEGIDHIELGCFREDPDGDRFLASLPGVEYQRSFLRMRHDAPDEVPKASFGDGLELYEPADRVLEMLRLRNETFQDHWNFVPWLEEDLRRSIETGENDPELWWFAAVDGEPAGMVRNQVRTDDAGIVRGYLGPIGTRRMFRGRGVARELLRHAVADLVARNVASVTLWVDSRNPFEATKLYRSHGFIERGEWRVFRKDL